MQFHIDQRFAAPLSAVEEALVDPAYIDSLGRLPKLGAPELLERTDGDGVVRMRVRYRFVGDVNAAVRRVVDPRRLTWVEESTLDRATHQTTWRIQPDHYASILRCSGVFRLDAVDRMTTRRVADAELKVNVPLVGGKVERAIVSGLVEHAALEEEAMAEWLRRP